MSNTNIFKGYTTRLVTNFVSFVGIIGITCLMAAGINAQSTDVAVAVNKDLTNKPVAPASPLIDNYRNVKIGASADQVKEVLGKPKFKDDTGFVYDLSDAETLQITLAPDSTVTAIAAIFKNDGAAPQFSEIFGASAKPETRSDGSIYKMVRYPDAGYWISYYKGTGNDATIALTIQKL